MFNTFILVLKAIVIILPWLINAVRDGKIKDASEDAVLEALIDKFIGRIVAANKAKENALNEDESNDPNNRARASADKLHNLSVG